MLSTIELENRLSVKYPKIVSKETNKRRLHNIQILFDFIENEILSNELKYQKNGIRLLMYETKIGEKIFIQFPGRESVRDNNRYPLDFRPKIIDKDGNVLPDMKFKDMWDILDKINSDTKK